MKKDIFIILAIILFGATLYTLTLRGAPGNPTASEFKDNLDMPTYAFELSSERGRYVHVVSLAQRGTFDITEEWALVAYPDVGVHNDKYYSFFAPGVSYFTLPFYLLGSKFGLGQVATFAAESIVSIITLVFIYLIGRRIFKLPLWAAVFAVLVYGFGSTSWSYAITLYQNAFTACFIVTALYAAWCFGESRARFAWLYAVYVWLAYALAITVDYPNALLMLPVMVYLAYLTFLFKKTEGEGIAISVRWAGVVTALAFVIVTGFHFAHNVYYYGGWSKLAGTLESYRPYTTATTTPIMGTTDTLTSASAISTLPSVLLGTTSLVLATTTATTTGTTTATTTPMKEKTVSGFFHEQNIPNGFSILMFSDERGLLFFTPIFLLSFLGIWYALRRKGGDRAVYVVLLCLMALNLFLYSSWGDPWGGWAYGPRYLIPSMPWLALFVGVALAWGGAAFSKKIIALALFLYSSGIALIGALTTNAIPPKSEAMFLPINTYNFLKNVPFLQEGKSGSFVYNTYVSAHFSLLEYFLIIYGVLALIAVLVLFVSLFSRHE
ncbi:MAG: hypothetical protein UY07_C0008G0009 [Parcubacteria group bacterium GW2011_GWA1_47_8]|nr:MAG: hypothetical protein UY07_C0008G0009 [Parcubacteria group bacterium GW2011_GWA1_47_8]